jgi:hypothetical protein
MSAVCSLSGGKRTWPWPAPTSEFDPTRTSLPSYANWTKFLVISMPDDIWWERSHRASGTNIVASLYRIAVVAFHIVQQPDRDVA